MNDFTFQYAIRLPNGSLYCKQKQTYSGIAYLFGPMPEPERELAVFDDRDDAEKLLDDMRLSAVEVGVDNLGAGIVTRLCSPFVGEHEEGTEFVKAVTEWIEQQR